MYENYILTYNYVATGHKSSTLPLWGTITLSILAVVAAILTIAVIASIYTCRRKNRGSCFCIAPNCRVENFFMESFSISTLIQYLA